MSVLVPGVVLAAGRSRRMGQAKALLPTEVPGETFISRIVEVLRRGGVDDLVVVVGPDSTSIQTALADLAPRPRFVINPDPDAGQLSSLLVGLRTVNRPGVGGMLVTLVDIPLIDPDTVRALLEAHRRTRSPIVRPEKAGKHGHPVIFDRSVFDELQRTDPDTGAKAVVRAHHDQIVNLAIMAEGPFLDVDTPDAYERVFGRPVPSHADGEPGPPVDRGQSGA